MNRLMNRLANDIKTKGWVYDDPKLNIHEFYMAEKERTARIYFKDLIFSNYGRKAYNAKNVRRYSEVE